MLWYAIPAAISAGAAFGLGVIVLFWRSCRASTAKWSDLVIDHDTGRASHTKVWVHVANAVALGLTVRVGWNATPETLVGLIGAVLAFIGGSQVASRIITAKYGVANAGTTTETTELKETKVVKTAAPATPAVAPSPESAANPQTRSTP